MCVQNFNRARGLAGLLSHCSCQASTPGHVNAAGDFCVLMGSLAVLVQTIRTDAIEQVFV